MQSRNRSRSIPPVHTRLERVVARFLLVAFAVALPGSPAWADVAGERVVSGEASITRDGDLTTIHASDGAIIDYDRFSVWSNEELHFIQPHDRARVLNRVFGDPTHIDGGLHANGIVYIVNPAGIFFGASAEVDVGGLYAAAGDISNEDFLAGVDRFSLTGTVENAGRIEAPSVALLGTAVANHGAIHAPSGTIALVAGEQVLLTRLGGHLHVEVEGRADDDARPAIAQTGSVDAGAGEVSFTTGDVYSLALNHTGITRGGRIDVEAGSGLVQVSGTLDASDLGAGARGGEIAVTGEQVALLGAELDASGASGGGTIRIGGDLRGSGAMPRAKRTFVDADSVLRADAADSGDGGTVIVYADEATAFHGAISARGGEQGGDGGFAEISGAVFLFSGGDVDLRAARGANGTLLYDPKDIELIGGVMDGDDDPDMLDDRLEMASLGEVLFGEPDELASPFQIYESEIEGTLGADIVLEATNSITTSGSFTNDGGEGVDVLRIADGQSLTMRTRNDPGDEVGGAPTSGIDLGTLAILTSGGGGVTLETGTGVADGNLGGSVAVGAITTSGADGAIGGDGGDVALAAGGTGSVMAEAIVTTGGSGSSDVGGDGGNVVISTVDGSITVASIDTSGGDTTSPSTDPLHAAGDAGAISLSANDADSSADSDVGVAGDLVARGGSALLGGEGDGGAGGAVTVRSDGVPMDVAGPNPDVTPTAGGGVLTLADVDTRGGVGGASGSGGSGGGVTVQSDDGAIDAGDITTSGGAGGENGGNAGFVSSTTRDADQSAETLDDNDLVLGNLVAAGGDGANGFGGTGGSFNIQTARSALVREIGNPDNVLQEELGGGDVTIASIDTRGGEGGTFGGRAGGGTLFARGTGRTVQVVGAVLANGGAGGSDPTGFGGLGGSLSFQTDDGAISVTSIDTRGGDTSSVDPAEGAIGASAGGGGGITLIARDDDDSGDSDIGVTGDLVARGGTAVEGGGGRGGSVTVRTEGVSTPLDPDPGVEVSIEPVLGGGTIALLDVDARGGDGGGGGAGGNISIGTNSNSARVSDAPITAGDLDVSGGSGENSGGNGGSITVQSRDADQGSDNDIVLADLRATGGDSASGGAGRGGTIGVQTLRSLLVTELGNPDNVLQEDLGGGDVIFGDADASGGNGALFGGNAGTVTLIARGPAETVNVGGQILARGGDASDGNGGSGATVQVIQQSTDLVVDYVIDASGGDGVNADDDGLGGFGGPVLLRTGFDDEDTPGDITIAVLPDTRHGASGAAATASRASGSLNLVSTGRSVFALGPVALFGNTFVTAEEGLEVNGTLDASDLVDNDVSLSATVGGASRLAGDVGSNRALADLEIDVAEDAIDPTLAFDGSSITTTGSQRFGPDMTVVGDTAFAAGDSVSILGDLDATAAAVSSDVTVDAGSRVGFGGDVGGSEALTGLDVDAPDIVFLGAGQLVATDGATGIRLNTDLPANPARLTAAIGSVGGDLRLESTAGDVTVGDGHKLSVAGRLDIVGDTIRVTDLSAVDIAIQASAIEIFARDQGPVLFPGGAVVIDGGTDLIANAVSFSQAPAVVGAGASPRIATLSGGAQNAGALRVSILESPITPGRISTPQGILDLAVPTPDPGFETPELFGGSVDVPTGLIPSDDTAGPAAPVAPAEVVAWLSCAPLDGKAPPGCAPAAKPPYASALDTERAAEIARDWRRLLGDAKRAEAGRAALARSARDPGARLGGDGTSPAGRAYLVEAARLLARTRMLGLDARTYREVRRDLLAGLVAAIGEPELDAERLLAAIEAYAMGMTI